MGTGRTLLCCVLRLRQNMQKVHEIDFVVSIQDTTCHSQISLRWHARCRSKLSMISMLSYQNMTFESNVDVLFKRLDQVGAYQCYLRIP